MYYFYYSNPKIHHLERICSEDDRFYGYLMELYVFYFFSDCYLSSSFVFASLYLNFINLWLIYSLLSLFCWGLDEEELLISISRFIFKHNKKKITPFYLLILILDSIKEELNSSYTILSIYSSLPSYLITFHYFFLLLIISSRISTHLIIFIRFL